MSTENPAIPRYTTVAKWLHGVMLVLILAQFVVAWFMPHIHRGVEPVGLVGLHVSLGVAILVLLVVRLLWRLTHRPNLVAVTWTERVSAGLFGILYLLMLVIPVLGWANANARGWYVSLTPSIHAEAAGVSLPMLLAQGSHLGHELGDIHGLLAWGLLALIGLHVVAALYHQLILKESVLSRIFWQSSAKTHRSA
jgi:cytochrome b561